MKRRKFLGGVAGLAAAFGVGKAVSEPKKRFIRVDEEAEVDSQVRALELENGSHIAYSSASAEALTSGGFAMTWMKTPLYKHT